MLLVSAPQDRKTGRGRVGGNTRVRKPVRYGGGDAPIVVRRVVFLDLDESGFNLVLGGTVLRAVVVRQELSVGSALAYSDGHVESCCISVGGRKINCGEK